MKAYLGSGKGIGLLASVISGELFTEWFLKRGSFKLNQ
jgi:hypothetical protein